ncbi:MAG: ATP-binding protein [Planctomycetes bacterium]|nr:ATP-binding protein [Planctomycetota bacterium]MBU1518720.1 ATP-binding protein [Planctomycetota bacterium]MBU2457893.1 ATP-binding protein [Planctomycetota bacterium]MBU2595972.1 ATP-binding protein [Planctomycetota bacterium]
MKTIEVKVQRDHLELLSRGKKPVLAVAELIWNGLDADAKEVVISFGRNEVSGIGSIMIADNGNGIRMDEAEEAFTNLGGSWKKAKGTTRTLRRLLHGRRGKGRFRAFSLGKKVEWETWYDRDGKTMTYKITGNRDELGKFQIGDETNVKAKTGTKVKITGIEQNFPSLERENAIDEITEQFALYMSEYSNIKIKYDGKYVDWAEVKNLKKDFEPFDVELTNGSKAIVGLSVIEWKNLIGTRRLLLCGKDGFTYDDIPPGIHAPGFEFTAYIKSDLIGKMDEEGTLALGDMHKDLKRVLDVARDKLKDYFRERSLYVAGKVVDEWKREDIYPYKDEPKDIIESTEREVFDICALHMNRYVPDFGFAPSKSKSLSLQLLKHAIETSPTAVRRIFTEVLELPEEKREELAKILETVSFSALINLAKTVTNRLQFINGFEQIVGDKIIAKYIKERSHLQHIIETELWIFGEHYAFCSPRGGDISLKNVLTAHLNIMGRTELTPYIEAENLKDIPDLCLYQQYIYGREDEYENLVIELKKPKVDLNEDHLAQIKKYARAVANDPLFDKKKTRWTFYLVSTNYDEAIENECNQKDRRYGQVFVAKNYEIWVKRWGDIIQEAKGRLEFVRKQMGYIVKNNEEGLEYLRKKHREYLPEEMTV